MKNATRSRLGFTHTLVTPALRAANCAGYSAEKQNGFTLIELLVVVLIIGILSAVALPQYQNAVEKARLTEALTNISSLAKAADLYILEHGNCEGELVGDSEAGGATGLLDIDLESGLDCTVGGGDKCASKNFVYDAYGNAGMGDCHVRAMRTLSAANEHADMYDYYQLRWIKNKGSDTWEKHCYVYNESPLGNRVCKELFAQGWSN